MKKKPIRKLGYYWVVYVYPDDGEINDPIIGFYDSTRNNEYCWETLDGNYYETDIKVLSNRLEYPLKAFL
jgi:hypothetical protein